MAKFDDGVTNVRGAQALGEVRTYHGKDKTTGEVVKTINVERTSRPYIEDLCDTYNVELVNPSLEWAVFGDSVKELRLQERYIKPRLASAFGA